VNWIRTDKLVRREAAKIEHLNFLVSNESWWEGEAEEVSC
jgi:hypothetical protein